MSDEVLEVPTIDIDAFLQGGSTSNEECKKVSECLREYGIIICKDPRVNHSDNEEYIDMMEQYFASRGEMFYADKPLKESNPDIHYQVGVTPEKIEKARNHCSKFAHYDEKNKPVSECPPIHDAKWRYFWNIGDRPENRKAEFDNVVPEDFPQWESKMNKWGNMMVQACMTIAEMAAIGMNVPQDTFSSRMQLGPHLLAPTGSDLRKYDKGTVFAGLHYDLNFLTIHGKSRFPGLFVWLRDGTKKSVKVPDGCLLLQAGIQLEWLTGGYIKAGFHEVIYTDKTKEKLKERLKKNPDKPVWRVSSTLFSHIRHDVSIGPLDCLKKYQVENAVEKYPDMVAYDKTMQELKAINLHSTAQS